MGTWLNSDGLYIKYGTDEGTVGVGGQFMAPKDGTDLVIEADLTLTSLVTSGYTIQSDHIRFPQDFRVKAVELYVETAATSGGAATLDIGLIRADRSTEHDNNGLVAALALTSIDAAGELVTLNVGSTGAGALIGTTLASTAKGAYLVAKVGTSVYTAGALKVRVVLTRL